MLAGPGTGKTETLTERISHFIREKQVLPNQVLMFTYTNKAASNMSLRIRRKLSLQSEIRGGTFHSVCYRLLRQEVCSKGVLPQCKVLPEHHAGRLRREASERHKLAGHLFSGRHMALMVDGSGSGYLKSVCDYVHLNPARAKLVVMEAPLRSFAWSSWPKYLLAPSK